MKATRTSRGENGRKKKHSEKNERRGREVEEKGAGTHLCVHPLAAAVVLVRSSEFLCFSATSSP